MCVSVLNSWSYLRRCIFLSFLVFCTSVCQRHWMCEPACRYTCICVEADFKKETSPDKVISLQRLSVFGRQSGDLQTDLACWIRFWAHSSGGSFLKGRSFERAMHCLQTAPNRATGGAAWLSLPAGMQLTSLSSQDLNRSSARPRQHFSPSLLLSGWEGGGEKNREKDINCSQICEDDGDNTYCIYLGCHSSWYQAITEYLLRGFDSWWSGWKMREFRNFSFFFTSDLKGGGRCSTCKPVS